MGWLIAAVLGMGAAVYFWGRWRLTERAIRRARKDLEEVTEAIGENRVLKLEAPGRELEELLAVMNRALQGIRDERVAYEQRERAFQKEIENISHDLRTPLTSILGYLKIMDQSKMTREEREDLEVIRRKAEGLGRLVSQFYDYSRAAEAEYVPKLEPLDLSRLLREAMLESYQELERRGVEPRLELPRGPVWVLADRDCADRLVGNLLQNAGRYADSHFTVRLMPEGPWARLEFENDGAVLAEEELPGLFRRFYVREEARPAGSTGLGLTIARAFAEKMGGSLTAELPRPGWLRFVVRLRLQEDKR